MDSTRSVLWMGIAALPGAGALVLYGFAREPTTANAQRCASTAPLPFDDADAQILGAAFDATAMPFASASFGTVRRDFDRYAQTWVAANEEACMGGQNVGQRLAPADAENGQAVLDCLGERRDALQATVSALGAVDARHLQHAWRVPRSLAPIEDCGTEAASGIDPEAARALAMAATWAALEAPELVAQHLEGIGLGEGDPHRAHVLLLQGHAAALAGETALAESKLESAVWAATTSDRPAIVGSAAVLLADVLSQRTDRDADAQRWWKLGSAANARLAISAERQFDLLLTEAALLRRRGALKPAVAVYEAALVLGERALGADHPRLAEGLLGASLVALALGKRQSATEMAERALVIARHALGAGHPQLTAMTRAFGSSLAGTSANADAATWLTRAAELSATTTGATDVATLWLDAGRAHAAAKDYERADAAYEHAQRWQEKHAPDNGVFAQVEVARATNERLRGDNPAAIRRYASALEILGRVSPPLPEAIAQVRLQLANVLLETGNAEQARDHAAGAAALLTAALGADSPSVADAWLVLADAQLRNEDAAAAIELARAALRVLATARGTTDPSVLIALTQLGTACLAAHRDSEAAATFERALAVAVEAELPPPRRASIGLSLATAQWNAGEQGPAVASATAARELIQTSETSRSERAGELTLADADAWFQRRKLDVPL